MNSEPSRKILRPPIAVGVLLVGLSILTIAFALKTGSSLRYADERQYFEIADNLAHGRGFETRGVATAYRPPAWPLLLAAVLALGLPGTLLTAVSALCMIVAAIAATYVGMRLTGSRWGSIASVLVLAYPLNLYTASTLYPQALATAAILMLWAIAVRVESRETAKMSMASCAFVGFLAAVLMLSVPTLVFTAVAILGWFVWQQRGNRVRLLLVAGLCAGALIGLWTVRNEIALGSPVVFSTSAGENLLIGNNPTATPSSGVAVDIDAARRNTLGMDEVERDSYLRSVAIDWISNNKSAAIRLYFGKVLNYFSPYNQPVTTSQGGHIEKWASTASFALLVVGLLARLLLKCRLPLSSTEKYFLMIFVFNAFVMAVFFTRTRFRQPLDNIVVIEAAVALVVLSAMVVRYARTRRLDNATALPA